MPRIASVQARSVVVPLDVPTSFSTRRVTDRHYTLVRVTGDDGVSGIGFCYTGSAGGGLPALAVRELLAPLLVGQSTLGSRACGARCTTRRCCTGAPDR